MRLWMQDYSILVAEKMYPVWEKALAAGPFGQPIMDAFADEFVFDTHTASVLSWINERGADFITAVTQEQKKAIKAMLARHVDGTYTVTSVLIALSIQICPFLFTLSTRQPDCSAFVI